jgi:hypothetical protein
MNVLVDNTVVTKKLKIEVKEMAKKKFKLKAKIKTPLLEPNKKGRVK